MAPREMTRLLTAGFMANEGVSRRKSRGGGGRKAWGAGATGVEEEEEEKECKLLAAGVES